MQIGLTLPNRGVLFVPASQSRCPVRKAMTVDSLAMQSAGPGLLAASCPLTMAASSGALTTDFEGELYGLRRPRVGELVTPVDEKRRFRADYHCGGRSNR